MTKWLAEYSWVFCQLKKRIEEREDPNHDFSNNSREGRFRNSTLSAAKRIVGTCAGSEPGVGEVVSCWLFFAFPAAYLSCPSSSENCSRLQTMRMIGIDKRKSNNAILCNYIASRNGKLRRLTSIEIGDIQGDY